MNRILTILIVLFMMLLTICFSSSASAQTTDINKVLSIDEIEDYKHQSRQLLQFLEYAFNTLGSADVTAREKDVIIQQSYLKFFKNNKVQIEDDLVEGRFVVTNKNVQAYLKDIDFFFKAVTFKFDIEDITYNVNDKNQVFFIIKTQRILTGASIEDEQIRNIQLRYIEINLDPDRRDLKIASIYTTRLSEKEDMRLWWSSLNPDWRQFFAKGIPLGGQYMMKDVLAFDSKWIVVERYHSEIRNGYLLESQRPDTIIMDASGMFREIRRIWNREEIDLRLYGYFTDISPLNKLTELRNINISKTHVDDLTPIRNLTRLETLDFSESRVTEIEGLRFAINLKNLVFSKTGVSNIEILAGLTSLERLQCNSSQIYDLSAMSTLVNLRDLRIAQTLVSNIEPIANLPSLQTLDISSTRITTLDGLKTLEPLERLIADNLSIKDLSPISKLPKLQYLSIESTAVNDIMVLKSLPAIKSIYCDRTLIGREKANLFIIEKPGIKVIYESKALSDWWQSLPGEWKNILSNQTKPTATPTREDLHEIANLTTIDISDNKTINSLEPLQRFTNLRIFKAARTTIPSLAGLKENLDLQWIDVSDTPIDDISMLSSMKSLEYLNVTNTRIKSIIPLADNRQLKQLAVEGSLVESFIPLSKLNNLELVYADNLNLKQWEAKAIYDTNPIVLIVYRTNELVKWWNGLSLAWQDILKQHFEVATPPSRELLQKLTDLTEIDLNSKTNLVNLEPLVRFHRLKILRMSGIQITDLAPLQFLETLQELYCANNPIQSFSAIRNLPRLTTLDCSNTRIGSLKDLGHLITLQTLNISGTRVFWLSPLKNLNSLRHIDCSNTKVRFLQPLTKIESLQTLRCYNTSVSAKNVGKFKSALPSCEVVYY